LPHFRRDGRGEGGRAGEGLPGWLLIGSALLRHAPVLVEKGAGEIRLLAPDLNL
jgi:hypothetical protein